MDEVALGGSIGVDAHIYLACLETLAGEKGRGSARGLVDCHIYTRTRHALCASACRVRSIIRDMISALDYWPVSDEYSLESSFGRSSISSITIYRESGHIRFK